MSAAQAFRVPSAVSGLPRLIGRRDRREAPSPKGSHRDDGLQVALRSTLAGGAPSASSAKACDSLAYSFFERPLSISSDATTTSVFSVA